MKTMVIFYPGCIEFEVMLACEILNSKYPVEIFTPDGADHIGSSGMTFRAKASFDSVKPNEYKIVLIPGGNPESVIGNKILNQILQEANQNKAILAAICAGPILLDQAGLLKGHKIAHGYEEDQLEVLIPNGFFKDVELTDDAIHVQDRIVTATPGSFIEFAVEVARLAEVIPEEKVSFWKKYYRGEQK